MLTNGVSASLFGGFTFGLSVSDTSIVFASVTTNTALPYVLLVDSFALTSLGLTDLSTVSGAQSVVTSDLNDAGNGVTIAANTQVGLGRVFFDVTSATTNGSSIPVTFNAFPTTSLAVPLGSDIPVADLVAGPFNVNTGIPEAATVGSVSLGLLAAVGFARKRTVNR